MGSPFTHRFFLRFADLTTHHPTLYFLVLAGTTLRSQAFSGLSLSWGISPCETVPLISPPRVLPKGTSLSRLELSSLLGREFLAHSSPDAVIAATAPLPHREHIGVILVGRDVSKEAVFQLVHMGFPQGGCSLSVWVCVCSGVGGSLGPAKLYWGTLSVLGHLSVR